MSGLRVGIEVRAHAAVVASTVATLPWMEPESIALDDRRTLVLLATSLDDSSDACAYAERRIRKSAAGIGVHLDVLSTEAFPPLVDAGHGNRPATDWTEPDWRQ